MTILAHASHWLAQVAYVAPVLLLVVALAITSLRDRRRERRGGEPRTEGPRSSGTSPAPPHPPG